MSQKKIAIVTGGTRGIGRAVSLKLARDGYKVLALYARNRAAAEELLKSAQSETLDIECLRGDLSHPEKFATLVQEIKDKAPQVNALIHCAASGVHKKINELTAKHLRWTLDINVVALHELLTSLLERMPSGSRVVAITSSGGTRVIPFYAAVGASKGALEALMRHYAAELAPQGIAVNLVCPGLVLTEAVDAFPDKEARLKRTTEMTPTGALTMPEDVAEAVSFLCGPHSSQIIGQTLVIDGGKTLSS